MAAARSPARTRPRSTARPPTRRAISPRTSSRPGSPSAARSSSPMRSASPSRSSIYVDLHGTGKVDEGKLETALREVMDLSPRGIRTHLGLNRPIYARTSAYGHFGRKAGRTTAASPGSGPTSADALKKALAQRLIAPPWPPRRRPAGDRRRRRLLRPPQGQSPPPGQQDLVATLLPRLRLDLDSRAAERGELCSRRCRVERRSISRSASAAASISPLRRAPSPERRLHRLRAVRQRHGEAAGARSSATACATSASGTRTRRALRRAGCRRRSIGRVSCSIPTLAEAAAAQAPLPLRRHARPARPHPAARRRAALRHRHRRLCRLGSRPHRRARPHSPGRPSAPTTGARPGHGWPGTRYEAKALREGRVPSYLTFRRR